MGQTFQFQKLDIQDEADAISQIHGRIGTEMTKFIGLRFDGYFIIRSEASH